MKLIISNDRLPFSASAPQSFITLVRARRDFNSRIFLFVTLDCTLVYQTFQAFILRVKRKATTFNNNTISRLHQICVNIFITNIVLIEIIKENCSHRAKIRLKTATQLFYLAKQMKSTIKSSELSQTNGVKVNNINSNKH